MVGRLKVIDLVIGIVAGILGIIAFFFAFPELFLKWYSAKIKMLDMRPQFEVRYYQVFQANPLFFALRAGSGIGHPLTEAKRISIIPEIALDDGLYSRIKEGGLFPDLEETGEEILCYHHFFYFKYYGSHFLSDFSFFVRPKEMDANRSGIDSIFGYNIQRGTEPLQGDKQIELGTIRPNESFYIPLALECGNRTAQGRLFRKYMRPVNFSFWNPVTKKEEQQEIRNILPNATIDSTGLLGRG